jgi:hypothetical protein
MATRKVKKTALPSSTDIAGLKSSRYEKLQVSYGKVSSSSYALGDTLVFADVPSRDIIRATVIAHAATPATLEVYPASDKDNVFTLLLPNNIASTPNVSYIIEYVRGTGRVGSDNSDNSGEGQLFSVTVEKYSQGPLPGATGVQNTLDEEQVGAE